MEIQFNEDGSPYVMWGGHKIEGEREPLTEKYYIEKAETELRERPEVVTATLLELRELLKDERDLFIPMDSDVFLIKFLRPCKFYAQSAFKKMKAYYEFRKNHQEYCSDLYPSAIRTAFKNNVISILAPRDQHGRRIMFLESGERWNPQDVPITDLFRGAQLALESAMVEPKTQVSGVIIILDFKGLSFRHIMQFTPSFAKMTVDWIQDCTPIRLKAVHIVNQPFIFKVLFAIFKPFLQEKLRSRIFLHGSDMRSLQAHVDPSALRARHEGKLPEPDIPGDVQWTMIHHFENDFKLANSYGYVTNNNK